MKHDLRYQVGFGNHFATEARPGTLPQGQNAPQVVAHGLYAEQLTGSAFTAPRHENLRSWLYRIRPSVVHGAFAPAGELSAVASPASPAQMRWDPIPEAKEPTDFLQGLKRWAVCGSAEDQKGCGVHLYHCNQSMKGFFYNADGEMLLVPQAGELVLRTEFGVMTCAPGEIAAIPRGVKFQVQVSGTARGYVCENYGQPFRLPSLGPIGANGLANPRDFQVPVAAYEDESGDFELSVLYQGRFWRARLNHSPLDVVGWHGNYAPYKYDLALFNTINTVSYDHPDPSIFTVLTSPSDQPGTANVDFVIFPPRWMVAEHTFRPPYFHRNYMSEFMGLVHGVYDAKEKGFVPGGSSLHNCMTPHGPEAAVFKKASSVELKPDYMDKTLAFMFESRYPFRATQAALTGGQLQKDYLDCWKGLG